MAKILSTPETPVVVTGGASGIGRASAEALAEAGRAIAVWDIDENRSNAVAEEIADRFGVAATGLGVDVRDLDEITNAVSASHKALGCIGGLVHSAGIDGAGMLDDLSSEIWADTIDINLRSLAFITKALRPDLKSCSGSGVVSIASVNATLGNRANPSYSASKGGLLALSRALADDLAQDGIRINCVSPGQIETPMLSEAMNAVPGLREGFERRIFLQRLAEPAEVGRVVRFLLSDDASYITGAELVVDGGNIISQRM